MYCRKTKKNRNNITYEQTFSDMIVTLIPEDTVVLFDVGIVICACVWRI